MKLWGALFLLLGIIFATLAPRRTAPGKLWLLFRTLFPSWRFFEDVGSSGELFYRIRQPDSSIEANWTLLDRNPHRGLFQLFHNPEGNLRFAQQSLIDQVLIEAETQTVAELHSSSVPYRLLQKLVESCVGTPSTQTIELEFQICMERSSLTPRGELLFRSSPWKAPLLEISPP